LRKTLLEITQVLHGEKHRETLRAKANLASIYRNLGRCEDAVKLQEFVLKSCIGSGSLGEDHPDTLIAMADLASTYSNQGRLDDVQGVVLKSSMRLLGEDHPDTLRAMTSLGTSCLKDGVDESLGLLEKSYEAMRKVLGELHFDTLWTLGWVARAHQQSGRLDESIALHEKVVEGRKRVLGNGR